MFRSSEMIIDEINVFPTNEKKRNENLDFGANGTIQERLMSSGQARKIAKRNMKLLMSIKMLIIRNQFNRESEICDNFLARDSSSQPISLML